jgi:hypothetical protein
MGREKKLHARGKARAKWFCTVPSCEMNIISTYEIFLEFWGLYREIFVNV